jgi:hypothetical protein
VSLKGKSAGEQLFWWQPAGLCELKFGPFDGPLTQLINLRDQ